MIVKAPPLTLAMNTTSVALMGKIAIGACSSVYLTHCAEDKTLTSVVHITAFELASYPLKCRILVVSKNLKYAVYV